MNKRYSLHVLAILCLLSLIILVFTSTVFADENLLESIKRLHSIYPSAKISDNDDKLLEALAIIDKMEDTGKWQEIRKLTNIPEFKYSAYYDDLLYIYLVHVANQKNFSELEALWQKMSAMQDSVHLFPAMLSRLFSQKYINTPQYKKELSLLLEYIETAPPMTLIHGPMIEGNVLFGYKIREDYSTGDLPPVYHLKDYIEFPKPLPGFSEDTQLIGLLEAYSRLIGFRPDRVDKLAHLYEAAGQGEKAADGFYRLAQHNYNSGQYEKANDYITRAIGNNPNNSAIGELKKKIDLALVLSAGKQPVRFTKSFQGSIDDRYPIEMNITRNGAGLSGTYFYKKIGTQIRLEGTVDDRNNLIIKEFDEKGNQTGVFKGYFISDTELKGTWSKPNGEKTMPFLLKTITQRSLSEYFKDKTYEGNKRHYTEEDVVYMVAWGDRIFINTENEKRLLAKAIRNEIYARHGLIFSTPEMKLVFESVPWYKPRNDFKESDLNEIERKNVEFISSYEKKMGWK